MAYTSVDLVNTLKPPGIYGSTSYIKEMPPGSDFVNSKSRIYSIFRYYHFRQ